MTANDNSSAAGRRSGSQKRQRTRNISIPVDAAEFIVIDSQARAAGMSRGSYGRASMLGTAGPRAQRAPTVDAEALATRQPPSTRSAAILTKWPACSTPVALPLRRSSASPCWPKSGSRSPEFWTLWDAKGAYDR